MAYSNYTMDQRDFSFKPDLEYEEIAILDSEGTIFYISQEGNESHVVFPTGSPQDYWFKSTDHPAAFAGFLNLYKDLGNTNYKIYGVRKNDGSIGFFDLKFDFTKYFYHSDFKKICNNFSIPMCHEYFSGSFSLKTLKKLITKTGKEITNLFFKPLQENDFGIEKKVKEKKAKKIKIINEEKKGPTDFSTIDFSSKENILYLILDKFNSPELFVSLDEYDEISLQEYTRLFCSVGFRKNYKTILEQELVDIVPVNRFIIVDYLCKEIAYQIISYALEYEDMIHKDNTVDIVRPYAKDLMVDIEKDIRPDIILMVDEMLRENVVFD
jgi:hypothetical protein